MHAEANDPVGGSAAGERRAGAEEVPELRRMPVIIRPETRADEHELEVALVLGVFPRLALRHLYYNVPPTGRRAATETHGNKVAPRTTQEKFSELRVGLEESLTAYGYG